MSPRLFTLNDGILYHVIVRSQDQARVCGMRTRKKDVCNEDILTHPPQSSKPINQPINPIDRSNSIPNPPSPSLPSTSLPSPSQPCSRRHPPPSPHDLHNRQPTPPRSLKPRDAKPLVRLSKQPSEIASRTFAPVELCQHGEIRVAIA